MGGSARTTGSGFLASAERWPDRPALQIGDTVWSYRALRDAAARLAATLQRHARADEPGLTAVFAQRSHTAFAGVLGALLRGDGYVPLNPSFPIDRSRAMLQRSGCRCLIVDAHAARQLDELLAGIELPLLVLLPEGADLSAWSARWPAHRFLGPGDLAAPADWRPPAGDPDRIAYLLFTSGSTGQPKGVMVAHRNVTAFVDAMAERYQVSEHDRFSQTFDLTFDLSAFDMFVCWERGACLCCPTPGEKALPGKYITERGITVWFSVPSTAVLMNRLRLLKPGKYPGLRLGLFCGEALTAEVMQRWAEAAPNAVLENLYGPTELTIACTLYRWDAERSPAECELGLVPIGTPYPGMKVLVADEQLTEVAPGETGELLMTGPQLTLGYHQDPQRTAAAFVQPAGHAETYYRTGDLVRRPLDGRPLVYLGRIDNQIKIQGYRVELGEIEAVLREEAGVDVAVAIGWPLTASGADGIVGFVSGEAIDAPAVRARVAGRLPPYMQPSAIQVIGQWPLNPNGKVDRKALRALLEASAGAGP